MLYRRFGRTELPMPVLSCGGMRYQHKWQDIPWSDIPPASQDNLEATIRRALELGITHIETARGYGSSEMQLGKILPRLPRQQIIVQTKVAPEADPRQFLRNFETSLRYLNLDYVDLLGIHGINTPDLLHDALKAGGCLDVAEQLVATGKVRFIGFSTHAPLPVIMQAVESNRFAYINLHWYYFLQVNWPAILAAHERDMGVFIISPSDKGGKLYAPPQKLVDLCAPLSPMVFNDLFCLAHPQVHTLSIGAARPTDFDEHLKTLAWLDQADHVVPTIVARLENALIEVVGEDFAKTWRQGLPDPESTPGGINIPLILWLRNLALAYDMTDFASTRYNMLGNSGHWVPGENAARISPRQLATCLVNSPHRERIPALLQEAHHLLGGNQVKRLSQS
ncbi:MAG: aldo/keto reductase [Cyanobacteriota bacterium]|nr:aldo/keto reductase [Cyanobacteriota bacterium]